MLILLSKDKLGIESRLGQPAQETLDESFEKFVEKFGEEVYTRAGKIIIVEENFFNVLKNRYGPTLVGEHIDFLEDHIMEFLAV